MNEIDLKFSLHELLALLGLAQCIYLLVFMALRSNRLTRATLPTLFFSALAVVFFLSAAESRWGDSFGSYSELTWLLWTLASPLSALLIFQIASVTKTPPLSLWGIFFLIPCAYLFSSIMGVLHGQVETWLHVSGVMVGCVSLLVIWHERSFLDELYIRKNGKERYWLILSLIILNIALLAVNFFFINNTEGFSDAEMIRNIIGISFVYVASTSLFRIYPQAVSIMPEETEKDHYLNDYEVEVAMRIEDLFHLENVYQEPSYKRSDLARELMISDSHLSKIVNVYFEKSVPQLLNTYRVKDAKVLLKQTQAEISVISEESGFNSIATFNRVFKDIEGKTPSEYRESKR